MGCQVYMCLNGYLQILNLHMMYKYKLNLQLFVTAGMDFQISDAIQ